MALYCFVTNLISHLNICVLKSTTLFHAIDTTYLTSLTCCRRTTKHIYFKFYKFVDWYIVFISCKFHWFGTNITWKNWPWKKQVQELINMTVVGLTDKVPCGSATMTSRQRRCPSRLEWRGGAKVPWDSNEFSPINWIPMEKKMPNHFFMTSDYIIFNIIEELTTMFFSAVDL